MRDAGLDPARVGGMWRLAAAVCTCVFLHSQAVRAQSCGAPAELGDGWAVSAPEIAGLDPAVLCTLGARFDAWKAAELHAVVVTRDGKLVYERYFEGDDQKWGKPAGRIRFDANTLHDERSISKSITSLLVGIGFDRGWFTDLDTPVFSFFPEYDDLRTPEKDKITLRHLLTMSAGFVWDESLPYGNPANSERPMDEAGDPYRYVLSQPMAAEPGTHYAYCGCSAVLLSAILRKLSGEPFDQLAQEALFEPLGIADAAWLRFNNGDPMAHGGLRLRPRELARIGQFVLDKGMWQGRQIVPASWIADSTAPHINGEDLFFYGYQWWLGRTLVGGRPTDWIAGVGYGGQRLFIVPDLRLVVAMNAGLYDSSLQRQVTRMVLNDYVLAAVIRP